MRPVQIRVASGLLAAALVGLSTVLPLWTLTMRAPQYPKGLRLEAYGTRMVGDLRELNILNHYIGMPPIEPPALETALFPFGIGVLLALCLLAPVHRWLYRVAMAAMTVTPFFIAADLQWRLYSFGHSLNPHAPIRLKPFTPLVVGTSKMGNFSSDSMLSTGVLCLVAAAIVLVVGYRRGRDPERSSRVAESRRRVAVLAAGIIVLAGLRCLGTAQSLALQERIDKVPPGGTLVVEAGTYQGPVIIHGPRTVIGTKGAVIDGGGHGSVVTIEGNDVVFRGFTVRNSGRDVTEEAAGIKATGNRHRIEGNVVADVYFGIHIGGGVGYVVENNQIVPGKNRGARPGHGVSVWNARDSLIARNRVSDARDGIYLSFADGVVVSGNEISGCRYGLHSMSSKNASFTGNQLTTNLLGAALMTSDHLVLRDNRIEQHREGTAAYGVLLKDIGDLVAEDNVIVANRIGIHAEGVAAQASRGAVLARNVIAGNEVGLALQANAALMLTENRIADNLTDVRTLGRRLADGMHWSMAGRGNSWSQYRGFDANGDGIGDVPHRVDGSIDALLARNPLMQAFLYTPAHLSLEAAVRMFPLSRQQPLLVDDRPLMRWRIRGSR